MTETSEVPLHIVDSAQTPETEPAPVLDEKFSALLALTARAGQERTSRLINRLAIQRPDSSDSLKKIVRSYVKAHTQLSGEKITKTQMNNTINTYTRLAQAAGLGDEADPDAWRRNLAGARAVSETLTPKMMEEIQPILPGKGRNEEVVIHNKHKILQAIQDKKMPEVFADSTDRDKRAIVIRTLGAEGHINLPQTIIIGKEGFEEMLLAYENATVSPKAAECLSVANKLHQIYNDATQPQTEAA